METECSRYYSDADVFTLKLPHRTQQCLSVRVGGDGSLFETMRQKIADLDGSVLSQFVMAGCRHFRLGMSEMGDVDWPLTWIQGDACQSGQAYSSQITAISGVELTPIRLDGLPVGYQYEDESARFCRFSGLRPENTAGTRAEQARSLLERMAAALEVADMRFTDTVRTWLYLDRLLGDLLAVVPKNSDCRIEAVASPLQCPAPDYKSSFSRAVELSFPAHRQLIVSGTASIDSDGRSAHVGDTAAQIELTMQVVREILTSRGMDWNDLARGIAYFKNREDLILWEDWSARNGLPRFSLAISHADICRHDLLFEIELDAVSVK